MNYYEILGVTDKATDADIKRAYRKLASQHHPDKGGDKNKFQEIQAAYDTLSNPQKRQQYDMQQNGFGNGFREFHFHGGDMHDIDAIFRNFGFGNPFGGFRQAQQRRNKDLRIEIPIPLDSTLAEQTKTISVATTNGERETVQVTIPRGVTNNTNIKYSGLGDNMFNTIPRGDLYVHFAIQGKENFIVNGIDLYTQVSVNCLLAITGTTVNVTGIDDKVFELAIPAGTQPNTRFRIPKQGLYQLNSEVRGNLYVDLAITVPTDLSSKQLDLVRSLINNQ